VRGFDAVAVEIQGQRIAGVGPGDCVQPEVAGGFHNAGDCAHDLEEIGHPRASVAIDRFGAITG